MHCGLLAAATASFQFWLQLSSLSGCLSFNNLRKFIKISFVSILFIHICCWQRFYNTLFAQFLHTFLFYFICSLLLSASPKLPLISLQIFVAQQQRSQLTMVCSLWAHTHLLTNTHISQRFLYANNGIKKATYKINNFVGAYSKYSVLVA